MKKLLFKCNDECGFYKIVELKLNKHGFYDFKYDGNIQPRCPKCFNILEITDAEPTLELLYNK